VVSVKIDLKAAMTKKHDEKVSGSVYIRSFRYKTGNNGKPFVKGVLCDQESTIGFVVWREVIEDFRAVDKEKILSISGRIDIWNSTATIVLESVKSDIYGYTIGDFLCGHDKGKLEDEFYEFLSYVSPKAKQLVNKIIDGDVKERFFSEFAAKRKHDACVGGLANHTIKMLRLAKTIMVNDERLLPYSDIIYIGVICHDIGKIRELYMGDYVKNSFISHREYGCEMMYERKNDIISLFDEELFYHLLSVIRGHHHVYDEKAKTIYAYIVHLIDMVDAQVTEIMETINALAYKEKSNEEKIIEHDGEILHY
jgi:3'-5' exoribonuclease